MSAAKSVEVTKIDTTTPSITSSYTSTAYSVNEKTSVAVSTLLVVQLVLFPPIVPTIGLSLSTFTVYVFVALFPALSLVVTVQQIGQV